MKHYFVLTGFLIGLMVGVVLVGREMVVAYENSIDAEIEAKLLETKALELEMQKRDAESRSLSIILVGDMMLSRAVDRKMESNGDFSFPFLKIYDFLNSVDLVYGNLETPISSGGKNQGSIYSFRSDPRVVGGLSFSNFGVLSLANNHIWDYGTEALLDTLKILKESNILPVGAGENFEIANALVVKEVKNAKIGFLAFTDLYPSGLEAGNDYPGISNFNLDRIIEHISDIKIGNKVDLLFVSLHWGEEYKEVPSVKQKEIAKKLIDVGVDVIVGHHPHVVQEFEEYKNGLIFYSLGNFIFDQNFSKETMSGYLVKIDIFDKAIIGWRVFETKINNDFQVELGEFVGGQKETN